MCFLNHPALYRKLYLFCCMPTTLFNLRYALDIPTGARTAHVLRIFHRSSLRLKDTRNLNSFQSTRLFFQFACIRLTLRGSQEGKHVRHTFLFICILLKAFTPRIIVAELLLDLVLPQTETCKALRLFKKERKPRSRSEGFGRNKN